MQRALTSMLVVLALTSTSLAGERIPLPLFKVSVLLPESWTGRVPPAKPIPIKDDDHTFQTQILASCVAAACSVSQDTCELRTYDQMMGLWDIISNRMLFPTESSMEQTTRIILDLTSKGATVAKPARA